MLIENALERGGGNGADTRGAIDFFFLDGGEDGFFVEQRDGGILIEAGDAEYEHERSLQAGCGVVHGKIAGGFGFYFCFGYGVENAVFVARDFGAEELVGREGAGKAELEIVGGDGGSPRCAVALGAEDSSGGEGFSRRWVRWCGGG